MKMLSCFVCNGNLEVRQASGRKSGKLFLFLKCAADGRHFRGFIYDPAFIARLTDGKDSGEV
jgi:hypothetical protein